MIHLPCWWSGQKCAEIWEFILIASSIWIIQAKRENSKVALWVWLAITRSLSFLGTVFIKKEMKLNNGQLSRPPTCNKYKRRPWSKMWKSHKYWSSAPCEIDLFFTPIKFIEPPKHCNLRRFSKSSIRTITELFWVSVEGGRWSRPLEEFWRYNK